MSKVTFDADYAKRLAAHMAVLMAYEDSSMVVDEDRLMLSVAFIMGHCKMVAAERGKYDEVDA